MRNQAAQTTAAVLLAISPAGVVGFLAPSSPRVSGSRQQLSSTLRMVRVVGVLLHSRHIIRSISSQRVLIASLLVDLVVGGWCLCRSAFYCLDVNNRPDRMLPASEVCSHSGRMSLGLWRCVKLWLRTLTITHTPARPELTQPNTS